MLKHVKNFKLAKPETLEEKQLQDNHNIVFLRSDSGEDWYRCQKDFKPNTIKIMYDKNGLICSMNRKPDAQGVIDVSVFFPINRSVVELTAVPEAVDIDGNWIFDGKKVTLRILSHEEEMAKVERKKMLLMAQANEAMTPLQYALELKRATEEEKAMLTAWKHYLVDLMRIDIRTAPCINWPATPVVC
ncbi:tail fiber assembly protein [Arsenophonus sp. ENCA]|uniref:tail fiber assembly protein n=1 Tax=Arsenophonus sp. ENCA TaxID=1987579 RepID=UPI0025C2F051|nr:tail fiber assembly protein [Arsenophonus sp. ENCA]